MVGSGSFAGFFVYTFSLSVGDGFAGFSAGLVPVPRILTSFLSISNQKGAPCMVASAVKRIPINFAKTAAPSGGGFLIS